jgi:hypothetical protein
MLEGVRVIGSQGQGAAALGVWWRRGYVTTCPPT